MGTTQQQALREQIRHARGKFLAMAGAYSLGVFNDNYFRQTALLLAVWAGRGQLQQYAIMLFALPYLVVAAPAGWLADRFPKRRIVIGAKALEVAAMICGAVGICTMTWSLMFAMVCLMGLQSAIFGPSLNGSIPELYPASYVTAANARLKVATTGAILLGFGLAGITLDMPGSPINGIPRGQFITAVVALGVALVGLLASFGVPKRKAADPAAPFPWTGPLATFGELRRIHRDRLLATVVGANAFVWFAGSLELLIINNMGLEQFGMTKAATSYLCLAQLAGVAVGGLTGSRLAKGRHWYRLLGPAAAGLGVMLAGVSLVPMAPAALARALLFTLMVCVGILGGMILVPCEAFIQVRPAPQRKGATIAAANFAVFCGILLSGPVQNLLIEVLGLRPTTAFLPLAVLALGVSVGLALRLPPGPGNPLDLALVALARALFRLRYRIRIIGLDRVAEKGTERILFLPNHPALIDPPIMVSLLFPRFGPRTWADQDQVDRPFIRNVAPRLGVLAVPGVAKHGADSRESIRKALEQFIGSLADGRCVLLYPAGHVYRSYLEDLRGNTAVHNILQRLPDVRVVLVRTRGLWGSRFSWADGHAPVVGDTLRKGFLALLLNGLFFGPRRPVDIEFVEPDDLPRGADRGALNQYLQDFYNEGARHNTYVPYTIWEKGGVRQLPEPFIGTHAGNVDRVPDATRGLVIGHLREETGARRIGDGDELARDLGVDSLGKAELVAWIEDEFGFPVPNPETLNTVGDVLLAACGESVSGEPAELKAVPARWFRSGEREGALALPDGDTVTEVFLNAARRSPGQAIVADQTVGVKTFRDVITACLVLVPEIRKLPGERVGIMLPASATASILYLAALFAGKTPVMVNWTVGPRNVRHCLDLVDARHVLTARALLDRLAARGIDLQEVSDRFIALEDVARRISRKRKLLAWLRARVGWGSLRQNPVGDTAAILFTSGSESLPKAVPLTHGNVLTDLRDVCARGVVRKSDRLIGMLPPFHSFGLTVTVMVPLCGGLPTVYHADPTEGGMLARLISAYKVSLLIGTPAFLNGIVRASVTEQLSSLRLSVTGADKCPDHVYDALAERCPAATVLEGYGVTECSPIISLNEEGNPRRGTIGTPLASLQYAIVDVDTGQRVETNRQGMLLVRGPTVFSGYINYDGASPFVEFDGHTWYRTGDLVRKDADGVLTFCGRLKRFTKLGGEMISLPAIEAVLMQRLPTPDDGGHVIAVEVTPDDEHPEIVLFTTVPMDRETANRCIREAGLSPLHNVRRVVQLDEIPLLGTGKTDYRTLRSSLRDDGR